MKYKIEGTPLPVVICTLSPGESMITERGSMSWMTPNMKMETTSNGGVGKAIGRIFSGEGLFQNRGPSVNLSSGSLSSISVQLENESVPSNIILYMNDLFFIIDGIFRMKLANRKRLYV